MKFYKCEHCGNIITKIEDKGVPVMCCGQKMTEIVPGTTDAAQEKHVPVVEQTGDTVKVKVIAIKDGKLSLSMTALKDVAAEEVREEKVVLPKSEELTTSLGELFKNIMLD